MTIGVARGFRASAFTAAVLLAGVAPPAGAAGLAYDFGPGCSTLSAQGRTITCNDGTTLTLEPGVLAGCTTFSLVPQGTSYTLYCATPNATGLWWRSDQNGRGTWVSHQGDTIFAVDFAYDGQNAPRWRTLIAAKGADNVYAGSVFGTNGPPFQAPAFDPLGVTAYPVGPGTIAFDDAEHLRANFFEGVERALVRQQFGPPSACAFGQVADISTATNYTDLWWNAGESGWGINLAHQGDIIFVAWFAYDIDGTPLWLVATANKTGPGAYLGDLYRATGPAGPATQATKVGTLTLTFANGYSASFSYTVQLAGMASPVTRTKSITRQVFVAPGTACQ